MEYTIKQVAERTHFTQSALRYYDKKGLIPQLKRSSTGVRIYTDTDICWIELISCLRNSGMSIERIKEFMNLCLSGPSALEERKDILEKHREELINHIKLLTCSLDMIEYKIEHYKEIGIFHIDS
jgi:DNA-binding transcriptional MerR regulator